MTSNSYFRFEEPKTGVSREALKEGDTSFEDFKGSRNREW